MSETGGASKLCRKCGAILNEHQIAKKRTACGPCLSRCSVEWAKRNRGKKRASNNAYHRRNSGRRAERTAKWRASHPEAYAAHKIVQTAIRNGTISEEPCSVCGSPKAAAHHEDYSKPYEIVWFCHTHHMEHHAMLAERGRK